MAARIKLFSPLRNLPTFTTKFPWVHRIGMNAEDNVCMFLIFVFGSLFLLFFPTHISKSKILSTPFSQGCDENVIIFLIFFSVDFILSKYVTKKRRIKLDEDNIVLSHLVDRAIKQRGHLNSGTSQLKTLSGMSSQSKE